MGDQNIKEKRQIVLWNMKPREWSYEEFLDSHPEYKVRHEGEEIFFWESLIYLGFCLGISENDMRILFGRRPDLSYPDLVMLLILSRLYTVDVIDTFTAAKGQPPSFVHEFLKLQEGMIPYVKQGSTETEREQGRYDENEKNRAEAERLIEKLEHAVRAFQETRELYDVRIAHSVQAAADLATAKKKAEEAGREDTLPELYQLRLQNALLEERLKSQSILAEERLLQEQKQKDLIIQQIKEEKQLLQDTILKYQEKIQDSMVQIQDIIVSKQDYTIRIQDKSAKGMELEKNFSDMSRENDSFRRSIRWWKRKSKVDARGKFMLRILHSAAYPDYQKEFIHRCYEEGMPLNDLQEFRAPGISEMNLQMMKQVLMRL